MSTLAGGKGGAKMWLLFISIVQCTPWWRFQKVETKGGRWKSRKDEGRKIAGRKILKGKGHVVNNLEEFRKIYKEIKTRMRVNSRKIVHVHCVL